MQIAPRITSTLGNMVEVNAGNQIILEATISGSPSPTSIWMKSKTLINETPRINIVQRDRQSQLVIDNATRDDSGNFNLLIYIY